MIGHWLFTSVRNMRKYPLVAGINLLGLTIGLSACLLISLFVLHELSYDDFEINGPRIARVDMEYGFGAGAAMQRGSATSTKVATTFKRVFPEIESAVRMTDPNRIVVYRDKQFWERHFLYADSSFFDLFSFRLLEGDRHSALSGPNKVVLTESTARRYFGIEDPVGKQLMIGTDSVYYQVTGVMADCPSNSQIKFDLLASFSTLYENQDNAWLPHNCFTYLLLKDPKDFTTLPPKIAAFMKTEMKGRGMVINFLLEPFLRIHLHSDYPGLEPGTSIVYIYILAGVALLILVIACFTYINLSTARSIDRAREVGIRKVAGASAGGLFRQFVGESFLICAIAALLSLVVVLLTLPLLNRLSDRRLPVAVLFSAPFLALVLVIVTAVSILAGAYPAIVLSRYHPVKVLKGAFAKTSGGQSLRRVLMVFQFVLSVFLLVSTFIMRRQLNYIQHKRLGYDRDHVVEMPMGRHLLTHLDYMKAELLTNPEVISLSHCTESPVSISASYSIRSTSMSAEQKLAVAGNPIDPDFIPTTGIHLIAGNNITPEDMRDAQPADFTATGIWVPGKGIGAVPGNTITPVLHFILNESAARTLGWSPQEAIGKRLFLDSTRSGYVKGVVEDFHYQSLHFGIRPLILFPEMRGRKLLVRITGRHLPETIAFLASKWKNAVPEIPFEYHFLDEAFNELYASELRLGKIMDLFSAVAIALACLGLFGLASYSAKQRVKEIGIRKVLGAPVSGVVLLLSAGFMQLVLLSLLIAFPLAWWAMSQWLEEFAYRIAIPWWSFLLAGVLVMSITLMTVGIQAVRAAMLNPVKTLRAE
ncbi:MAG TPA: ABC transporter permease [Puia sp.]|nr:ABC transporter permease [Puia sp.]